jgi:hypothetical protein
VALTARTTQNNQVKGRAPEREYADCVTQDVDATDQAEAEQEAWGAVGGPSLVPSGEDHHPFEGVDVDDHESVQDGTDRENDRAGPGNELQPVVPRGLGPGGGPQSLSPPEAPSLSMTSKPIRN